MHGLDPKAAAAVTSTLLAAWALGGPLLGGVLLQPGVGWLLDRHWGGAQENGVRLYDAAAWQNGFLLMFIVVAVALALVPLARESHCRQA